MELSPTSQPYFYDLLSDYGTFVTAIQLLNGNVTTDLSRFPPDAATWLWQFKRTQKKLQCSSINDMLHTNEFQQAFKVVKEFTSSLPSGINYTLWKSIAHDHYLSNLMVIMMRLPFMHGLKHDHWAKCIDDMLKKKAGAHKIRQLQIIGLVEAHFNTALKLFFVKHLIANT